MTTVWTIGAGARIAARLGQSTTSRNCRPDADLTRFEPVTDSPDGDVDSSTGGLA